MFNLSINPHFPSNKSRCKRYGAFNHHCGKENGFQLIQTSLSKVRGWWVRLGHGIKVALDFFSFIDEVFLLVKKWIIIDYRIVTPNMLTAWAAISWWMRVTSAWVRTLFICLIINEISKLKCATKTGLCLYFLPLPRFEQNFQLKFKDLVENVKC